MKDKFSKDEITKMNDIVSEYRSVSDKLEKCRKKADEIQEEVKHLTERLSSIKEREKILMENLHRIHGDFSLEDVYYAIENGK